MGVAAAAEHRRAGGVDVLREEGSWEVKPSAHPRCQVSADILDREREGHVRQSRMLGPLYLPLIGLQSLCHAAVHYDLCGRKKYKPYTHFWTERWADRLGGVRR